MSKGGGLSAFWRLLGEDVRWMEQGACRQGKAKVDAFFVQDGKRNPAEIRAAKAWCECCEVRAQCLAYALEHPVLLGVWGGMTETQRNRLRRAKNSGAA